MSILLTLATLFAMANPAFARGQGALGSTRQGASVPNTGQLLRQETPAEIQRERQKEALVAAWVAQTHNGTRLPAAANAAVSPYCVVDPDTGNCVTYTTHYVSGGGEWYQEPLDEPNWCGPSSATNLMLHWNYNAVVNEGSVTVPNDGNTTTETYTGPQGYMAWMANKIWIPADNRHGVSNVPYRNGSPIGWLKDGVNVATGTQYYIIHTSTNKDDMQGNVNYDIANDNHPMIYLVNANKLPNWHTSDTVNHYVEGYGYGYYSDGLYMDYYADAISASDKRATAGPFETDYITMFAAVQASNGGGDYIV